MEQNIKKKMTKYDRKLQAREEAAKRSKRKNILSIIAAVAIVGCIAALLIIPPIVKNKALYKEYFKINNESVSELEFNYYRTNFINNYAQYLQLFGITSAEDLETTVYNQETGMTWSEFFTEQAAISIQQNRALIADAKANNVSLSIASDYSAYMEELAAQAEASGITTDAYLYSLYGTGEKQLKSIIKDSLAANAYSNYLYEQKTATDEEVQAEYDANKASYDSVDYRVLEFAPKTTSDSTEEDIAAAKADAKAKAQEMLDKLNAGEDFETLCATYAPEEDRAAYADSETDKSLITGETSTYAYGPYSTWLYDSARTAGETTLYEVEETGNCYVLLFEKSYMGDDVLATIKDSLTYNAVMEYIEEISASYAISDPENNLPTL